MHSLMSAGAPQDQSHPQSLELPHECWGPNSGAMQEQDLGLPAETLRHQEVCGFNKAFAG